MRFWLKSVGFFLLATVMMAAGGLAGCNGGATTTTTNGSTVEADRVEVDYFFESDACFCLKLASEWVHSIVNEEYKTQLDSGKLVFHSYDTRDAANKPVMEQFNSPAYALYITTIHGEERVVTEVKTIWFYTDTSGTNEMLKSKFWGEVRTALNKALGE